MSPIYPTMAKNNIKTVTVVQQMMRAEVKRNIYMGISSRMNIKVRAQQKNKMTL